MSTGPGPTRKADGTADASVDDIADLLVEDDPSGVHAAREEDASEETSEDGLDVMLETPGPALANPFMPPPPSPMGDVGDEADSADENGAATNLAYEDLLAKLVLPAKAPEPEPEMPALMSSLPLPEPVVTPAILPPPTFPVTPAQSLQIAPPAEEQTLVTENPLVAEEQEAAVREGRSSLRDQPFIPVHEDIRTVPTEPVAVGAGVVAAKSRLVYLMLGGLLVLGGMILAVLVLKLLMPTPAPSPPAVVAPTPPPPPPPSAPPAHVEPLPPSAPPTAAVPTEPPPAAQPENPAAIPEAVPNVERERPQPRPHRVAHPKPPRPAPPRATATPKPAPKAAPAPAPKPPKAAPAKKASKMSGYADPFDN